MRMVTLAGTVGRRRLEHAVRCHRRRSGHGAGVDAGQLAGVTRQRGPGPGFLGQQVVDGDAGRACMLR